MKSRWKFVFGVGGLAIIVLAGAMAIVNKGRNDLRESLAGDPSMAQKFAVIYQTHLQFKSDSEQIIQSLGKCHLNEYAHRVLASSCFEGKWLFFLKHFFKIQDGDNVPLDDCLALKEDSSFFSTPLNQCLVKFLPNNFDAFADRFASGFSQQFSKSDVKIPDDEIDKISSCVAKNIIAFLNQKGCKPFTREVDFSNLQDCIGSDEKPIGPFDTNSMAQDCIK